MERRAAGRKRILNPGQIELRDSAVPCKVVDLSTFGAGVVAHNAQLLPDFFTLVLPAGERVFCRTVWRSPERIGVTFRELRVI